VFVLLPLIYLSHKHFEPAAATADAAAAVQKPKKKSFHYM
jgi:hypothetical protein